MSMSLDEQAAQMAEEMLAKAGAAGDMPISRKDAQGGLAAQAGGKQIDEDAEKGGYGDEDEVEKANKTGADVTNEPGRQGQTPYTGDKVTMEPKREYPAGGAQPGEPTDLAQDADEDEGHRKRKPGKVGVSNGAEGGQPGTGEGSNLDQAADSGTRARKDGKVGIQKAESVIDADDLIKSLETLEAIAEGSSVAAPADRRADLAEKLADGTLSKAEMQELHGLTADAADPLVKADVVDEDPVEKSYQDQFAEDDVLQKGYEVSDFLERHSQVTAAALDQVQERLAKSIEAHRDRAMSFNVQLAKSLKGLAQLNQRQEDLIKSLTARLERVETTPLPRKSVGSARALEKSMDGEAGGGGSTQLSRTQLMDGLEQMMLKGGLTTASGHRIDEAMALLEQGGSIAKSLYSDVSNHLQKSRAVA